MTQKKKRPMKQNGGGGWFSYLKLSLEPEPHSTVLELEPEPVYILFITTHGGYQEDEVKMFASPIKKINKINIAAIGECCTLSSDWTEHMKIGLSEILTFKTDMETKSNSIIDLLKSMETQIEQRQKTMGLNKEIGMIVIEEGDEIVDKKYSIDIQEGLEDISPYFDTITLLSRGQVVVPNLLKDIRGMPTRTRKTDSIKLSEILLYIKENFPEIINLIIVDGSCSPVLDTTHNRKMRRDINKGDVKFGGNYKNISMGKLKKLKQTNNKKLRNTKTKRRKTRKMRRRLNK
jgi:hypothetical protein